MVAPMRRLANSVGGNVARLSTRGTLVDGELRSAQAPNAAPPVWFVFTGAHACCARNGRSHGRRKLPMKSSLRDFFTRDM